MGAYYADLRAKLFSNISETYDINNMSDNDKFLLLMGFQGYDTITLVIKFVKCAFESRVTVDIWCISVSFAMWIECSNVLYFIVSLYWCMCFDYTCVCDASCMFIKKWTKLNIDIDLYPGPEKMLFPGTCRG